MKTVEEKDKETKEFTEQIIKNRFKKSKKRERLIWQKCPVCNGRKEINALDNYPIYGQIMCPVCYGTGIINQFGKPPYQQIKNSDNEYKTQ